MINSHLPIGTKQGTAFDQRITPPQNLISGSLSLLPASPKVFYERESELEALVSTLLADPARAAILGPGGMRKTTLAMATSYLTSIIAEYNARHFISSLKGDCEAPRNITMRGAERPSKMKWSRPFLAPLEPLSPSAARQNFSEVADHPNGEEEEALAILVDLSGYTGTLALLEAENTALLLDGHDKRSNLERSITLSLGSPRIASSPNGKSLALLSVLPDGIVMPRAWPKALKPSSQAHSGPSQAKPDGGLEKA
ncbi:hypothetical protein C8J57DRAFT_1229481 [Mycena rebaudengoi]|nr:hypothetical protein C8J57DRAFT_1229481 [Mycena rebaudengoi]